MPHDPNSHSAPLPPGQQLAARGRWPQVGEREPEPLPEVWTVEIAGLVANPLTLTLDDLRTFPRADEAIDIHCVTRWSKLGLRCVGVRLADVLQRAAPLAAAQFVGFTAHSTRRHDTSLPLADALALGTLLVWEVDGRPLAVDHGGPLRTMVPGRYFYKSLKWLKSVRLLERDELGFWEREAGYHNTADPALSQRYMAPNLSRLEVRAALKSKNFAGRELRSIDCRGHELTGLDARGALLRDADFRDCPLAGARFDGANLSNAKFAGADLRGASFAGADVEGADFAGCELRECDFRRASLFGATFRAADSGPPTRLDRSTLFDLATLDALMPNELRYVRAALEA